MFKIICFLITGITLTVNANLTLPDLDTVLKHGLYVDKTMIIREVMVGHEKKMFTAPPLFGKTFNLEIIKRFFEITVDKNGVRKKQSETENYKLFSSHGLNIYTQDRTFFDKHFGMYPVLYLDMNYISFESHEEFLYGLRVLIWLAFDEHKYLKDSVVLSDQQKSYFMKFHNKTEIIQQSPLDLARSVKMLSGLLYGHFNKKCILLIDEYDGPIKKIILLSQDHIQLAMEFYAFFSNFTIKHNPFVDRALMTGCISQRPPSKVDENNVFHFPFLEKHAFTKLFGFTAKEVKTLLKKQNLLNEYKNVENWYDGYSLMNEFSIYNPFSIINFIALKTADMYWAKEAMIKNLEFILRHKAINDKVDGILLSKMISLKLCGRVWEKEIVQLWNIVSLTDPGTSDLTEDEINLFVQFMLDLGYFYVILKIDDTVFPEVPNLEVRKLVTKHLRTAALMMGYQETQAAQEKVQQNFKKAGAII
uniref:AAA-ATPase-like domain-containing protein n=1 Tax=Clastoptera arizonana TaxID=38151 RepID=A0A1B6EBA4_9HEMI